MELVKPGERFDEIELLGLKIIQRPDGFRFGTDAVLLADFARVRVGDRVADLGTGTGVIPLLLEARKPAHEAVGVEIDGGMSDMAARSVELNGLSARIEIVNGDLREMPERLQRGGFDVVTCNPPYQRVGTGEQSPHHLRSIARSEAQCTLEDVARAAFALLKNRGRLYIVIRASRLSEALTTLSNSRLEPKLLRLVQKSIDSAPTLALIEAVKHGGRDIRVLPPLITHESGDFTKEMLSIYSGGGGDGQTCAGCDAAGESGGHEL